MNYNRVYSKAAQKSEIAVEENISPSDAKKQSQHLEWYKLAQTQEFLEFLQKEEKRNLELAVKLSCQGAEEKVKDKALIRADTLKQIIDYARSNREPGRSNNSDRD